MCRRVFKVHTLRTTAERAAGRVCDVDFWQDGTIEYTIL